MTRPLAVVSSDSLGRTTMRSSRGCRFMFGRLRGVLLLDRAVSTQSLRVPTIVVVVSARNRRVLSVRPTPDRGSGDPLFALHNQLFCPEAAHFGGGAQEVVEGTGGGD